MIKIMKYGEVSPNEIFARGTATKDVSGIVKDIIENVKENDVAKRGAEDSKIRYLLFEAQMKLGRNLKTNETATLVWLYDDLGLDVSVILMIIQFALANEKANIRFIEKTAVDLVDRGITSISDVDEELRRMTIDVEKAPKKEQEGNYGSYSIDEFEKMLNSKD